jgi:hypothetical protein
MENSVYEEMIVSVLVSGSMIIIPYIWLIAALVENVNTAATLQLRLLTVTVAPCLCKLFGFEFAYDHQRLDSKRQYGLAIAGNLRLSMRKQVR